MSSHTLHLSRSSHSPARLPPRAFPPPRALEVLEQALRVRRMGRVADYGDGVRDEQRFFRQRHRGDGQPSCWPLAMSSESVNPIHASPRRRASRQRNCRHDEGFVIRKGATPSTPVFLTPKLTQRVEVRGRRAELREREAILDCHSVLVNAISESGGSGLLVVRCPRSGALALERLSPTGPHEVRINHNPPAAVAEGDPAVGFSEDVLRGELAGAHFFVAQNTSDCGWLRSATTDSPTRRSSPLRCHRRL